MAVNNQLTKRNNFNNALTTFTVDGNEVKLSPQIVRQYLVSGNPELVTDQEIVYYINLCKAQGLNPFIKDSYLIKYGSKNPAQMVVSKDTYFKRAEKMPNYDGMNAGVIVMNKESGDVIYRSGAFYLKSREELVGGWAEVFKKDITHPTRIEVEFDEYAGRTQTGALNQQWSTKGATMIRKVACAQALREAYPNNFQQLYIADEMGVEEPKENEIPKLDERPLKEIDKGTGAIRGMTLEELKEEEKAQKQETPPVFNPPKEPAIEAEVKQEEEFSLV